MCKFGVGRIRYARVLVEIDASKELPETIEVEYINALKEVIWASHNDDGVRKNEGIDDDGKKSNNEKLAYQPKKTRKYMKNGNKNKDEVNERVGKNDQENNDTGAAMKTSTSPSNKKVDIRGDLKVTLKVFEQSFGDLIMFSDMHDFNDCVNQIEVEDICSSGLNFTWTKNLQRVKQDIEDINNLCVKKVSSDDAMFMIREISDKEVKDALFDIGDNKALGPDGYTALFFKKAWPVIGGRGLRQGEPISPYLFIVVMEVFNLIMQRNISRDKNFHYHFGCKKLKITHIYFADDLIVFCHGYTSSMKVLSYCRAFGERYRKNVFWSINDEDLESLLNLKNTMYHSR
uniref:RNA-directed DNA polymerase, eukaryota, reverse transcriptase zinc-binding domain protein n=1 Tax=Tanacetum cinerariifolium TaxID=118510 RepID=A0A6L2JG51_TANCI|nr:RNA-directed DNA polymerase, eukaryota, reverse transcriptase zinc-binding domain protein [Tanacetum cinerariifolium]